MFDTCKISIIRFWKMEEVFKLIYFEQIVSFCATIYSNTNSIRLAILRKLEPKFGKYTEMLKVRLNS